MMNFVKNFAKDEDGAVSIDWVVLTAAIVAMGVAAGFAKFANDSRRTGACRWFWAVYSYVWSTG